MRADPRFPHRPTHPDFALLSQVLREHDEAMDDGTTSLDEAINRYIDIECLTYAAVNQARMASQRLPLVVAAHEVEAAMAGAFVSAFVAGMKYQQVKQEGDNG